MGATYNRNVSVNIFILTGSEEEMCVTASQTQMFVSMLLSGLCHTLLKRVSKHESLMLLKVDVIIHPSIFAIPLIYNIQQDMKARFLHIP